MLNVTFWGVRGSTPCPCSANDRYGGNTSCVTIEAPGLDPIVLDLGTGLREYGDHVPDESYRCLGLVTHLHWDHVQGFPFFAPLHRADNSMVLCGRHESGSLHQAFDEFMRPPYFPVRATELMAEVQFRDLANDELDWGRARVVARDVPHTAPTNGYRIEVDGVVVAYLPDHQEPLNGEGVAESVLELCRDADLVIHDAQFEPHELAVKSDWGHCTPAFALEVAATAGAKRLALFHHDPSHGDATLDRIVEEVRAKAEGTSVTEVISAAEGLSIVFADAAAPAPVAVVD